MRASYPQSNIFSRCSALAILFPLMAIAGQSPTSGGGADSTILQALLAEVHELRLALERSNTAGPRMQLAIARFQIQQERVDRRERELSDIRNRLTTESITKDRLTATISQFDEQARQTQDPEIKKQSETAAAATRADLEVQGQREQQIRLLEADASNQLKIEQEKLNELSARLDQLERGNQQE